MQQGRNRKGRKGHAHEALMLAIRALSSGNDGDVILHLHKLYLADTQRRQLPARLASGPI